MLEAVKTDCDGYLRSIVAERNAIAGYHLLLQQSDKAIETYQNSLQTIQEMGNRGLTVDYVQFVHIYYNLIYASSVSSIPLNPIIIDDYRRKQEYYETLFVNKAKEGIDKAMNRLTEIELSDQRIQQFETLIDAAFQGMGLDTDLLQAIPLPNDLYEMHFVFSKDYFYRYTYYTSSQFQRVIKTISVFLMYYYYHRALFGLHLLRISR